MLVAERLQSMWTQAIAAGPTGQPILDGLAFEFNTQTPGILDWISERGAEFVTRCTEEQKDAIAALLEKKMRESHTVDELARLIRPCIGLTEGDAKANARYYDNIVATMRKEHPRMKIESIRRKALDASQKYAEKQHRARAFTIAQTEGAFAYNRGADEGIRQAQGEGYLGTMVKRWSTSGDDSVCDICNALEGTEVDMDSECYHLHTQDAPALSSISKWLHREEGSEKVKKFSDFIKKSAEPQKKELASNVIKGRFKIAKSDDDKHLAFGWANVAIRADGEEIEDWQEDIIEPEELENAAYQYVLLYREGGEMHERGGAAVLVESVVFTEEKMQAMGIPAGTLPIGWWIGFKVTDEDVWEKVKDGTYPMFSIEGEAERIEVEDENTL